MLKLISKGPNMIKSKNDNHLHDQICLVRSAKVAKDKPVNKRTRAGRNLHLYAEPIPKRPRKSTLQK